MLGGGVSSKKLAAGLLPRDGHNLQMLDGAKVAVRVCVRNSAAAIHTTATGGKHD